MPNSKQLPLTAPRGNHEHDFGLPYAHWEAACFDRAEYFSVIRMAVRGEVRSYKKFTVFTWAVQAAKRDSHTVLYAVSPSGRFTALDREKWDEWAARWKEDHNELFTKI